jgi:tRNA-uridine 2-sulfurtransferase
MHTNKETKKVYIGLSGGVDSSVSAYLLKQSGYDVTGVFIKVWQPEGIECTWKEDRLDAMRVAAELDIPFITLDLEKEYKQGVIDYMIEEYRLGRTPNPDVMCNKHVKFGAFYDWARQQRADFVATGHYTQNVYNSHKNIFEIRASEDSAKDQGYFLWTLTQDKLPHILFPVGGHTKEQVREIAQEANLYTKDKKDSQGLCFIGKLDIKEFLGDYIANHQGDVLDTEGRAIGHHDGTEFITLGERHGFVIDNKTNSDAPYYVVAKDIMTNTITVATKNITKEKKETALKLSHTNWISEFPTVGRGYQVRVRHTGEKNTYICESVSDNDAVFTSSEGDVVSAPGQSAVVFDGDVLLGGGIIG